MAVPDFPFDYSRYIQHPAGLGSVPMNNRGMGIAVIGAGVAGLVAAYELLKLGLRPVVYEAEEIGGRMRSRRLTNGCCEVVADLGAMRFPKASTLLFHYTKTVGLETTAFPNPLSPAVPSTVVNLEGKSFYARTMKDLPIIFNEVAREWQRTLEDQASLHEMQHAIRSIDLPTVKRIWNTLVQQLDDKSFYSFLCESKHFASFRHREIFGQVGFGSGGWDTDFPNSVLEILRVIFTGADGDHQGIIGGSSQLPHRLWYHKPGKMQHWPANTNLSALHPNGLPLKGVKRLYRHTRDTIAVLDADGEEKVFNAVVFTPQTRILLSGIDCHRSLLPTEHWIAIERTHYMPSSKFFVAVDRPFWLDLDPSTGRHSMSTTLTDRVPRGLYLFGSRPDRPAAICMSYTWADDSLKLLSLSPTDRLEVLIRSLKEIYPRVDLRSHIRGSPVSISWEKEPCFMGAFKANLPGHYRYQRRLFTHFMQNQLPSKYQGFFLAGDSISWTAGFAEGAIQSGLNAVWAVQRHVHGASALENPGPGDCYDELAPVDLDCQM